MKMASLKSHPNKAVTGLDYVDQRSTLYFNKFQYRARLAIAGLNRTHSSKNFLDFLKVIERQKTNIREGDVYFTRIAEELDAVDLDAMEQYFLWRNKHVNVNKAALVRVEGNTAGVFSNDLALLKTLAKLYKGVTVDYTEVDQTIPQGTRYYVEEPKHKFRIYLKSKRVEDTWKESINRFIDRYKGTDTVIVPSGSLNTWLNSSKTTYRWQWNTHYCSSHYFIDFDDDSTNTLFSLMFGDMIHKRYKLEKRPAVD